MIYAVDPGVRETGIVAYYAPDDGRGGTCEHALTVRYSERVETQDEMARMCADVCQKVNDALSMLGYDPYKDSIVIEGFEYMGGMFHESSLKTVFLVGAMMVEFPEAWWQTSADVLNPHRAGNHRHIKDNPAQINGGDRCTNEHERSALAHAVHYADSENQGSLF